MNTNHYYKIGKNHVVCQDYAISGQTQDYTYAIVCDGCSSSKEVDFGARVLALAAREVIQINRGAPLSYDQFGKMAILRAEAVSVVLPINPSFLDCTLLVAWVMDNKLTAFIYGDGVFIHKSEKGMKIIHVSYNIPMDDEIRGAPAYLSYHLSKSRKSSYDSLGGNKEVFTTLTGDKTDDEMMIQHSVIEKMNPFAPVEIYADVAPGDIIVFGSDGIDSFRNPDASAVGWQKLIPEYVGFKNTQGVFVQRRMAAFERHCQKEQLSHLDDISLAAIAV